MGDLKGTLSNTCRAKKLLHFSTRKNFTETILGLIELGKLGKDDFSASFWKHSDVIFKLSSAFPNWQQLDLGTKNKQVREKLETEPLFLEGLVRERLNNTCELGHLARGGGCALRQAHQVHHE